MQMDTAIACALDPDRQITPQIYQFLHDRIIRNELKPGDQISESEIARNCSVSRQPVREAFIKLADQGLLWIRPQRGTIVSRITYDAVLDARFLREAFEADIVKVLARDPDPALITELRAQIMAQKAIGKAAPRDFIDLDEKFHRTFAEGAGKGGAWKQIEGLKSQMDRVRYLSLGDLPVRNLIGQHENIVNLIAAGNVSGAEAAIRSHLRAILHDLPEITLAHPEFFELPAGGIPTSDKKPIEGGERE
ncbi:Transcriptional regulator, GntR family [Rhodovulum sp. P5]|uniref:GntR family transcriptional regulator n=1 Tax=Rhodovulum sp. P5 TaxID=1564506 RepID=UPI0009C26306|nr:GntR family transcriptional regulator [Rhodovulum sp. P5]ARE42106.1 Transcriptional regulator, GntR family [Rhodovulum sp. P5]